MTLFTMLFGFNVRGRTDLINPKKSTKTQMNAGEQHFYVVVA